MGLPPELKRSSPAYYTDRDAFHSPLLDRPSPEGMRNLRALDLIRSSKRAPFSACHEWDAIDRSRARHPGAGAIRRLGQAKPEIPSRYPRPTKTRGATTAPKSTGRNR